MAASSCDGCYGELAARSRIANGKREKGSQPWGERRDRRWPWWLVMRWHKGDGRRAMAGMGGSEQKRSKAAAAKGKEGEEERKKDEEEKKK